MFLTTPFHAAFATPTRPEQREDCLRAGLWPEFRSARPRPGAKGTQQSWASERLPFLLVPFLWARIEKEHQQGDISMKAHGFRRTPCRNDDGAIVGPGSCQLRLGLAEFRWESDLELKYRAGAGMGRAGCMPPMVLHAVGRKGSSPSNGTGGGRRRHRTPAWGARRFLSFLPCGRQGNQRSFSDETKAAITDRYRLRSRCG